MTETKDKGEKAFLKKRLLTATWEVQQHEKDKSINLENDLLNGENTHCSFWLLSEEKCIRNTARMG